ncbi:MAG TPA: hypothetical protein VG839_06120 [Asticcacaulis sp.]|nr:hypothetical protein [Asticcacaulis sp.]
MLIIWKGLGGGVVLICMIAAVCLLPFKSQFDAFGPNGTWIESACVAALTASGTLALATYLEKRDRKADKDLTARDAHARHTFYWVSLMNWGYISALAASALFAAGCLAGVKI